MLQPKIIDPKQLILVGMSFYGDPFDLHSGWDEENQIGCLWKRLMKSWGQYPEIFNRASASYEVHISNEETSKKGLFEVFVGVEVDIKAVKHIPVELLIKVLPLTQYAVFTFSGEQINSDWEKILQGWLATSGYRSSYLYNFQYYDERFKGIAALEESVLDVYVPIQKAD